MEDIKCECWWWRYTIPGKEYRMTSGCRLHDALLGGIKPTDGDF